jgi:hypothetical protein
MQIRLNCLQAQIPSFFDSSLFDSHEDGEHTMANPRSVEVEERMLFQAADPPNTSNNDKPWRHRVGCFKVEKQLNLI